MLGAKSPSRVKTTQDGLLYLVHCQPLFGSAQEKYLANIRQAAGRFDREQTALQSNLCFLGDGHSPNVKLPSEDLVHAEGKGEAATLPSKSTREK